MLSFFPRDVLGEILDLIESVSEGFSYILLYSISDTASECRLSDVVVEHWIFKPVARVQIPLK